MTNLHLRGKSALVTGASSDRSIGWGVAKCLAAAGADVIVNDVRDPDALSARADDLRVLGVRGLAVQADVTDSAQVDAMFERAVHEFGKIDIVVSNAGIIRWQHFLDITPDQLRAVVNVNIHGNANVCRAAARHMIRHGKGGRIIITSSVQSDMQYPISPVYGATKKAMHLFVGTLALELAKYNITVNHFGPGWIRTPLNDPAPGQQTPEDIEAQIHAVPLRRDGHLDELGAAVVYLASDAAAYTTGAFIRVDGGLGISKYTS
jgi:NAD(P)-dependent dehydrogenase (short-subunit alcohol dehydrogenase family)